jgi:hypothetical protein
VPITSHGPSYVDRFQKEALMYVAEHPDYDRAGYSHDDEYSYIYLYSDDGNTLILHGFKLCVRRVAGLNLKREFLVVSVVNLKKGST